MTTRIVTLPEKNDVAVKRLDELLLLGAQRETGRADEFPVKNRNLRGERRGEGGRGRGRGRGRRSREVRGDGGRGRELLVLFLEVREHHLGRYVLRDVVAEETGWYDRVGGELRTERERTDGIAYPRDLLAGGVVVQLAHPAIGDVRERHDPRHAGPVG